MEDAPTAHQQLSTILGWEVKRIRITDEAPPRISVIDLAAAITTKDASQAAEQVAHVKKRHPEVTEIFGVFKFRGRGQKNTPVTDLCGAVELTFLLPGRHAEEGEKCRRKRRKVRVFIHRAALDPPNLREELNPDRGEDEEGEAEQRADVEESRERLDERAEDDTERLRRLD